MATSGGGGAVKCFGCQKAKHSPLVIRHDGFLFTILLGALEGSCRLDLNAKGRTGLPTCMYIKRTQCSLSAVSSQPMFP